MTATTWKHLSVSDFLQHYRAQCELKVAEVEQPAFQSHIIWQKQTVQAFFVNFQWAPKPVVARTTEPVGLSSSVQSYLQQFVWDAPIPSFQKPPVQASTGSESRETAINLQNFSDLF